MKSENRTELGSDLRNAESIEKKQIQLEAYHDCRLVIELASVEINRRRSEREFFNELSEEENGETNVLYIVGDHSVNTMRMKILQLM